MFGDFDWNERNIQRLRELWDEKNPEAPHLPLHSTAEIGRILGCGKNATVGKARRLDLPPRPSPIILDPKDPRRTAKVHRVRKRPTLPSLALPSLAGAAPAPAAPPRPVAYATPRVPPAPPRPPEPPRFVYAPVIECCWPIGTPKTKSFRFCGDPSEPGRPYCSDHVKLAFVRPRDRREAA